LFSTIKKIVETPQFVRKMSLMRLQTNFAAIFGCVSANADSRDSICSLNAMDHALIKYTPLNTLSSKFCPF